MKRTIALIMMLALSGVCFAGGSSTGSSSPGFFSKQAHGVKHYDRYVKGELLVTFRKGTAASGMRAAVMRSGGSIVKNSAAGFSRVKLEDGRDFAAAMKEIGADPAVESVQPNYIYHSTSFTPNDADYGYLWGLHNTGQAVPDSTGGYTAGTSGCDMGAPDAWNIITDCSAVTVAVVDSGVNYNQEDLAANMWTSASYPKHGYDFVDNDNDPMDLCGHGTHVAGTIGAVGGNALGTIGVCPAVRIMAVRSLNAAGSGTTVSIAEGIGFAVAQGAKVINMSLGGGSDTDAVMADAIGAARDAGVLVVAAAGNDGADVGVNGNQTYPCNYSADYDNVVSVAALDQNFALADFSNYSAAFVNVGAPGVNITSTVNGVWSPYLKDAYGGWTRDAYWGTSTVQIYESQMSSASYSLPLIYDPASWNGTSVYRANADDTAYRYYSLGSVDAVVFYILFYQDIAAGDMFSAYCRSGASSDVTADGTLLFSGYGSTRLHSGTPTFDEFYEYDLDLSSYGADFTLGYNLTSDASVSLTGVAVCTIYQTLALAVSSYAVYDGTSMAAPHAAGLAAMIWAYNPSYTYADVAVSLRNGGRNVPALLSKTTTGKAVNMLGSLSYIQPPTGLKAAAQ